MVPGSIENIKIRNSKKFSIRHVINRNTYTIRKKCDSVICERRKRTKKGE